MATSNHSQPFSQVCDLCGLGLRAGSFDAAFFGQTYHFCCLGCRQVFSILIEAADSRDPAAFRESDLFKQCQENGIIPRTEADLISAGSPGQPLESASQNPDQAGPADRSAIPPDSILNLNLKVSNMWCPACAWVIDEFLKKNRRRH